MTDHSNEIDKVLSSPLSESKPDFCYELDNDYLTQKEWKNAWLKEFKKRANDIDNSKEGLISHDDVMASLRAVVKNQQQNGNGCDSSGDGLSIPPYT